MRYIGNNNPLVFETSGYGCFYPNTNQRSAHYSDSVQVPEFLYNARLYNAQEGDDLVVVPEFGVANLGHAALYAGCISTAFQRKVWLRTDVPDYSAYFDLTGTLEQLADDTFEAEVIANRFSTIAIGTIEQHIGGAFTPNELLNVGQAAMAFAAEYDEERMAHIARMRHEYEEVSRAA